MFQVPVCVEVTLTIGVANEGTFFAATYEASDRETFSTHVCVTYSISFCIEVLYIVLQYFSTSLVCIEHDRCMVHGAWSLKFSFLLFHSLLSEMKSLRAIPHDMSMELTNTLGWTHWHPESSAQTRFHEALNHWNKLHHQIRKSLTWDVLYTRTII